MKLKQTKIKDDKQTSRLENNWDHCLFLQQPPPLPPNVKSLQNNLLLLMRKSYNYELILYNFQIVVRNILDPYPDSGVIWIQIEIFGWFRIRIRIRIRVQ